MPLDLGVAELALGLPFELRLEHLDADDRGQALAHVLAGEVGVLLFEDSRLPRVAVEDVGERGAKTCEVAPAFDGMDRVRERDHVLDERLVVLESDLDLRTFDLAIDVERRHVDDGLVAVQRADESDDATLEVKGRGQAQELVFERDLQPLVQVRHLAEAVPDDLPVEFGLGKDLRVGPEANDRARVVGLGRRLDRRLGHTALVLLLVDLAATVDPDLKALAQEVDR